MKYVVYIIVFAFSLIANSVNGQEESTKERTLYVVKTDGGKELFGYILKDDGREIQLETKNIGTVFLKKENLVDIRPAKSENIAGADYSATRATGPYTTRYYFTTNALPVKKYENYAMLHLYGPEVHFSLSDKLSIGIMTSWIASPFCLAAKYSLYSKNDFHLAAGTIIGSSGYIGNGRAYGGLHWLTATKGNRSTNFSISAGYGYINFGDIMSIGEKYRFDKMYDSNYSWEARLALEEQLLGPNRNNPNLNIDAFQAAGVIGISGITPVGKSSSFIFDSMFFLRKSKRVKYSDLDVTVSYTDTSLANPTVTETITIEEGEIVTSENITATVLFMPSMRFQQAHNKAIQVSLGGFVNVDSEGNLNTAPFPMVSWLRQF